MLKHMKIPLLSSILAIFLFGSTQADVPIVINELMASNNRCTPDPQGQYDDWIEIYNRGSNPINIGGIYLTDDINTPTKWQIPSPTIIQAGGYLLIWADDDTSDAGLHANFKLDADGEEIGLFESDGTTLIDSVTFNNQKTDISYGRLPDGGNQWRFFGIPSPGQENEAGFSGIVADTKFSMDRGFYDMPFSVTITTETAGATIRYTTDGSTPDESNGQVYTGPIQISTTTCLRAMAHKNGWMPTNVDTHTYIFIDDVITQTQEQAINVGYPESWKGQYVTDNYVPADYEMDPEVYNDPDYSGQMIDALLSIPTLSIVTDKDFLFDPSVGIYMNPEEEGTEEDRLLWERPTSAELFCPDNSMEFQVNCGLRLQGGHSRKPFKAPKHSFSLRFRDIYGPTSLDYKLFGDDWPVDSFDSLHLRAGFNDVWIHRSQGQNQHAQYIYDQWMRDSLTEMGHKDALQGFFVHLYLNGMYWGIYQLHERPDADHYATYHGGDSDNIDAINGDPTYVINDPLNTGSVSDGTIDAWLELKDVVADRDWEQICKLVDMDSFIDWTLLTYFAGTTDIKRGTNWRAAGGGPQRRPWRFYSWDAEHVMERVDQYGIGTVSDPSGFLDYLEDIEEFRVRFGDRVHKHLFENGALTTESNLERWAKRSDEVQLAIIAESARWGDYRRDVHPYSGTYPLYTKNDHWIPQNNYIINEYLPRRTPIALDMFRAFGMYPNVEAPVFQIDGSYQHGGQVSMNSLFSTNGTTGTIYYSLDGTDPRVPSTTGPSNQITLVPENAPMLVLVPTGTISDSWTGSGTFNDGTWTSGTGGIGYERNSGYEQLISLDTEAQMYGGNTTCYIRIPFTLDSSEVDFSTLTLKIRYDDGFIAYLNGVEVASSNAPVSPQWDSMATDQNSDAAAVNFQDFDISTHLNVLNPDENILAIHGLNISLTSSDFLISAELVAVKEDSSQDSDVDVPTGIHQYTTPITLTESTHIKARALSGSTWSALNEATYAVGPVAENLRITEIMYHPQSQTEPNDPNEEFIELTNIGAETINLNLVKFTNGIDFTFSSLELAPGEYIIVVQDIEAFEARYGTEINIAGQYTGRLANGGERICLEDAVGQTILDFSYKDGWHDGTDGQGHSLIIIDPTDPDPDSWDDKDSWRASIYIGGSPGGDDN